MFEWRVNQIRVDMMERVLNHMEKQGYEVQVIVPLHLDSSEIETPDSSEGGSVKTQMLLAGKKLLRDKVVEQRTGMPAVTPENIDVVYGRDKANIGSKSA